MLGFSRPSSCRPGARQPARRARHRQPNQHYGARPTRLEAFTVSRRDSGTGGFVETPESMSGRPVSCRRRPMATPHQYDVAVQFPVRAAFRFRDGKAAPAWPAQPQSRGPRRRRAAEYRASAIGGPTSRTPIRALILVNRVMMRKSPASIGKVEAIREILARRREATRPTSSQLEDLESGYWHRSKHFYKGGTVYLYSQATGSTVSAKPHEVASITLRGWAVRPGPHEGAGVGSCKRARGSRSELVLSFELQDSLITRLDQH